MEKIEKKGINEKSPPSTTRSTSSRSRSPQNDTLKISSTGTLDRNPRPKSRQCPAPCFSPPDTDAQTLHSNINHIKNSSTDYNTEENEKEDYSMPPGLSINKNFNKDEEIALNDYRKNITLNENECNNITNERNCSSQDGNNEEKLKMKIKVN